MFGYKSFLRIGALNDSSITGLYRESYELQNCNFGFQQGMDKDGKAQTDVRGGTIQFTYANLPPNEIVNWMLSSRKYEDGAIVICDENDVPLEKIYFEQAACIGLTVDYLQQGKSYIVTKVTLQARKIKIGDTLLDNCWI